MAELHRRIIHRQGGFPPLALRPPQGDVARDLPPKTRYLHPRIMPPIQASRYDEARVKLAASRRGGGIPAAPPYPQRLGSPDSECPTRSGRVHQRFGPAICDVRHSSADQGREGAGAVFIEHRQMQYRSLNWPGPSSD